MLSPGHGGSAPAVYVHALGHVTYEGHHPERTLLYQLIEQYYPALVEPLDAQGRSLPTHVHQAFEAYLKCGRQDQRRLTPEDFRVIDRLFAIFSNLVTRIHQEVCSQQPFYLFLSKGVDTKLSKLHSELQVIGHDLQSGLTHVQLISGVGFPRQLRQLCGSIHGGGDGFSLVDNAVE